MSEGEDLRRDVIKSDTADIYIRELDLQMSTGSLGGLITTVEGLLTSVQVHPSPPLPPPTSAPGPSSPAALPPLPPPPPPPPHKFTTHARAHHVSLLPTRSPCRIRLPFAPLFAVAAFSVAVPTEPTPSHPAACSRPAEQTANASFSAGWHFQGGSSPASATGLRLHATPWQRAGGGGGRSRKPSGACTASSWGTAPPRTSGTSTAASSRASVPSPTWRSPGRWC